MKAWDELSKLTQLPELSNVLLVGNPLYEGLTKKQAAPQVIKYLPGLKTLDGEMVMAGSMEDEVLAGVKEKLEGKHGSCEDALGSLGTHDFVRRLVLPSRGVGAESVCEETRRAA